MAGKVLGLLIVLLALIIGTRALNHWVAESEDPGSQLQAEDDLEAVAEGAKLRDRSLPATAENLCERLDRAREGGRLAALHQTIRRELGKLSADRRHDLLVELEATGCSASSRQVLLILLVEAMAKENRAGAADLLIGYFNEDPDGWGFFMSLGFFEPWLLEDPDGLIGWLEDHRNLLGTTREVVLVTGESTILTELIQSDVAKALERVESLPESLAEKSVAQAFGQRWNLLEPDDSIAFLRQAFNGEGHEKLAGTCCGYEVYELPWEDLEEFLGRHEASAGEREEIVFCAVSMKIGIGLGNKITTEDYLAEVREFAMAEAPGAVGRMTAHILATDADRTHKDKEAVDQLFEYKLEDDDLRHFIEIRGTSLDPRQRERIDEQLEEGE